MAIYERSISERLSRFVDGHLQYWDDGDAENGPHLASDYDGPEWAMDLYLISMNPNEYGSNVAYGNTWYAEYMNPIEWGAEDTRDPWDMVELDCFDDFCDCGNEMVNPEANI